MSTMNILSVTLIVLILAAVLALFFGMRAAAASEQGTHPVFVAQPTDLAVFAPDTMDEIHAVDAN